MIYNLTKMNPLAAMINNSLGVYPVPSSISYWWGFGSLSLIFLFSQILTGLFLSMHYYSNMESAFMSVDHLSRAVNGGWLLRTLHANGASMFFVCLYLHMGRGMYYGSYQYSHTWSVGVVIFLLTMATAFLGYVLPWGQMSFWGATVITNFFSAIPVAGSEIVMWLWGGFSVDAPTLSRFYSFHFLFPFVILGLVCVHLIYLHEHGSSNPLGLKLELDKIPFGPFFFSKDMVSVSLFMSVLFFLCAVGPWSLGDPENFIPANPLVTPTHIQPEWYFLFAYAILRAIPNKLGGVIALAASVLVLLVLPLMEKPKFQGFCFYPLNKLLFSVFFFLFIMLTWGGAKPVESPYIMIGQLSTFFYFFYFLGFSKLQVFWDRISN